MSSQIVTSGIDTGFPVAGKDNPTQGFRDNFSAIKTALTTASSEITELQLTSAHLTGVNDFSFQGSIERVTLNNTGYTALSTAPTNGEIDYTAGYYQKSSLDGSSSAVTYQVNSWPPGGLYGNIKIEVAPTVTTPISITFTATTLLKEASLTLPHVSTSTHRTVWDLWTIDGGATVFVKLLGSFE